MAQVRGLPLRHTRRRMAGEIETMKRECDARKQEQLRDQRRDDWALQKYVDKVTEETDALMLEAEPNAAITENIKKERDALRLEAEELRAQCKESSKLKNQLYSLMQKYKDITEERNAFISEVQIIAANRDAIKKNRDALEREAKKLRAQAKDPALLENELKAVRVQCDDIAKERDSFKLKSRCSGANFKAMSKVMEALKVETEELRAQFKHYALLQKQLSTVRQECENVKEDRNAFMLRAQQLAESRETINVECNALKIKTENLKAKIKEADLLEEKLNTAKRLCDSIKRETLYYKSKARWAGGNRKAMRKDIDTLKLETETLRARYKNSAVLEKQLQTVKQKCENIKKERNAFILRAQRTAADRDAMRMERDDLKRVAEILRAQRYKAALQEEELNVVREDSYNLANETDSLILEAQHMGTYREDTEDIDDAELQEDQLNVLKRDCYNPANERDSLKLEAQHMETYREDTEDIDDAELQEDQLDVLKRDCYNPANERDSLILEAQHMGTYKEDTEDIDDAERQKDELNYLKIVCYKLLKEREYSQREGQHKRTYRGATEEDHDETALQEEQLNVVRESCDNLAKEGDCFNARSPTHRNV